MVFGVGPDTQSADPVTVAPDLVEWVASLKQFGYDTSAVFACHTCELLFIAHLEMENTPAVFLVAKDHLVLGDRATGEVKWAISVKDLKVLQAVWPSCAVLQFVPYEGCTDVQGLAVVTASIRLTRDAGNSPDDMPEVAKNVLKTCRVHGENGAISMLPIDTAAPGPPPFTPAQQRLQKLTSPFQKSPPADAPARPVRNAAEASAFYQMAVRGGGAVAPATITHEDPAAVPPPPSPTRLDQSYTVGAGLPATALPASPTAAPGSTFAPSARPSAFPAAPGPLHPSQRPQSPGTWLGGMSAGMSTPACTPGTSVVGASVVGEGRLPPAGRSPAARAAVHPELLAMLHGIDDPAPAQALGNNYAVNYPSTSAGASSPPLSPGRLAAAGELMPFPPHALPGEGSAAAPQALGYDAQVLAAAMNLGPTKLESSPFVPAAAGPKAWYASADVEVVPPPSGRARSTFRDGGKQGEKDTFWSDFVRRFDALKSSRGGAAEGSDAGAESVARSVGTEVAPSHSEYTSPPRPQHLR